MGITAAKANGSFCEVAALSLRDLVRNLSKK